MQIKGELFALSPVVFLCPRIIDSFLLFGPILVVDFLLVYSGSTIVIHLNRVFMREKSERCGRHVGSNVIQRQKRANLGWLPCPNIWNSPFLQQSTEFHGFCGTRGRFLLYFLGTRKEKKFPQLQVWRADRREYVYECKCMCECECVCARERERERWRERMDLSGHGCVTMVGGPRTAC